MRVFLGGTVGNNKNVCCCFDDLFCFVCSSCCCVFVFNNKFPVPTSLLDCDGDRIDEFHHK